MIIAADIDYADTPPIFAFRSCCRFSRFQLPIMLHYADIFAIPPEDFDADCPPAEAYASQPIISPFTP